MADNFDYDRVYYAAMNAFRFATLGEGQQSIADLDFTTLDNLHRIAANNTHIVQLVVPEGQRVQARPNSFTANRALIMRYDPNQLTEAQVYHLILNGFVMSKWLAQKQMSEGLKMMIISNSPRALEFFDNPSEILAMHAIRKSRMAARYAIGLSEDFYLEALNIDVGTFQHLPIQTPRLCRYAIMRDYNMLGAVLDKTPELCMFAVKFNPQAFVYVPEEHHSYELYKVAIKYPNNLALMIDPPADIYQEALKEQPAVIRSVKNPSDAMCDFAVKCHGDAIRWVPQTPERCKLAVNENPASLRLIIDQTPELYDIVISKDKLCYFAHANNRTEEYDNKAHNTSRLRGLANKIRKNKHCLLQ